MVKFKSIRKFFFPNIRKYRRFSNEESTSYDDDQSGSSTKKRSGSSTDNQSNSLTKNQSGSSSKKRSDSSTKSKSTKQPADENDENFSPRESVNDQTGSASVEKCDFSPTRFPLHFRSRRKRAKTQRDYSHFANAEVLRRTLSQVDFNLVDENHSRSSMRRRAISEHELRTEIRELKNILVKRTMQECSMF